MFPGRNADPSADGLHLRRAAELFDDTKVRARRRAEREREKRRAFSSACLTLHVQDLNYTYLGKEIQRGILCDRWTANQSIVSNRTK